MQQPLEVSLVETEADMQALAPAWNRLWERTASHSAFQRFEWIDAAWQWIKTDAKLWVFTLYEHGNTNALVGILPMVRRTERYRGLSVCIADFLSVPDNQFCDALLDPAFVTHGITAIARTLSRRENDWDILRLNLLPEDSLILAHLPTALADIGFQLQTCQEGSNPGLSLEGTWQDYYGRRSRRLKKGNNLVANRFKKAYSEVRLEWLWGDSVSPTEFEQALTDVVRISENSWKKTTGRTLGQSGPHEFIQRLTYHAQRKGWLSIGLLYLDGMAIASEYQIIHEGYVYALRADYDEAYSQDSPGTYLQWKLIEKLFSNGLKYYHMGPGGNPYKRRWAEDIAPLYRLRVYSHTSKGRVIRIVERFLVPLAKQLQSLFHRSIDKSDKAE